MNDESQPHIMCSGLAPEQVILQSGESAGINAPDLPAKQEPFTADRNDGILALVAFALGFFFARWVLFSWQGWGVTVFTLGYCGIVTRYLFKKGIRITRAGWFWLAVVIFTGLSFSLWNNNGLEPWRSLLLFGSAVYWIVCATGLLILGKTSNWIGWDSFNSLFVIPIKNIGIQYKSLAFLSRNRRAEGRQIVAVGLGLLLTLMVAGMVLPMLLKADSGGFGKITSGFLTYLQGIQGQLGELIVDAILAVPIAAYIFGLVAGSAHRRGSLFQKDSLMEAMVKLKVMPMTTVYTFLGLLCTLYLVFVGSQIPYFFSAFIGQRPEGWQVYAEYARSGFFELCRIAAINLSVLVLTNFMSAKRSQENIGLKLLNSLLALLTLVLIATAFSKMAMYIGAYGLSMRRLLPCFFMAFLTVVCIGVIALQKWQFSMGRLAAGVGVVMLCGLCLLDPDGYVTRYNADRYLAGTLSNFDVEILYRSGPAGVDAALQVYAETNDPDLQAELKQYLQLQQELNTRVSGQPGDNLEKIRARNNIAELSL
ncbi:MAG: DUF4173 domain-containing protein [Syntrophomonadaceae bacterium]|nr:DUF4173 domain-containing protein [Syntrophomonadaceae bacterium]